MFFHSNNKIQCLVYNLADILYFYRKINIFIQMELFFKSIWILVHNMFIGSFLHISTQWTILWSFETYFGWQPLACNKPYHLYIASIYRAKFWCNLLRRSVKSEFAQSDNTVQSEILVLSSSFWAQLLSKQFKSYKFCSWNFVSIHSS